MLLPLLSLSLIALSCAAMFFAALCCEALSCTLQCCAVLCCAALCFAPRSRGSVATEPTTLSVVGAADSGQYNGTTSVGLASGDAAFDMGDRMSLDASVVGWDAWLWDWYSAPSIAALVAAPFAAFVAAPTAALVATSSKDSGSATLSHATWSGCSALANRSSGSVVAVPPSMRVATVAVRAAIMSWSDQRLEPSARSRALGCHDMD